MIKFQLRVTDSELEKKWDQVKIKTIKEHTSLNNLIQSLLKEWLKERR